MGAYPFAVTGQDRKNLVDAISEILGQPKKYLGVPSLSYEVGAYTIDKHGTRHGEYNIELLMGLTAAGFTRTDIAPEELLEAEAAPLAEATNDTPDNAAGDITTDEIPTDDDGANVADTNADTAVDDNEVNI